MKISLLRFNIILLLLCCIVPVGCQTTKKDDKTAAIKKKYKKEKVMLQFHLAGRPSAGGRNIRLSNNNVQVSVDANPFLDFRSIEGAQLIEDQYGYAIQVQFNSHGAFVLDTVTTEHRGKSIAIGATQPKVEQTWLAAPAIQERNSSGFLTFTPDVTRDEAERIVYGVRNVVKEMKRLGSF